MSDDYKDLSDSELLDLIKKAFDALGDIDKRSAEKMRVSIRKARAWDGDDECKMCGKERILNNEGYCSSCWQVWNS